jgi:hypothetical protein
MADPDKFKALCPKRFHRKESLFPNTLPHLSLRELLLTVKPGIYDEWPCKGRGHKGTVIRVWRRHVNVADRLRRRREIHALWRVAVRAILGPQAQYFDFVVAEHEAYIIYYCVGCRLPLEMRTIPATAPIGRHDLPESDARFVEQARLGWFGPAFDLTPL